MSFLLQLMEPPLPLQTLKTVPYIPMIEKLVKTVQPDIENPQMEDNVTYKMNPTSSLSHNVINKPNQNVNIVNMVMFQSKIPENV